MDRVDGDMAGIACDPGKPAIDAGKPAQIEVALRSHVGVGVERDIRDRFPVPDEIVVFGKVLDRKSVV